MKQYYLMVLNYDPTELHNNLFSYYDSKNMVLEKLEYLLNYQNIVKREVIIGCFKNIDIIDATLEQKNKFYQLFKNFEFEESDKLNIVLWTLWKHIK